MRSLRSPDHSLWPLIEEYKEEMFSCAGRSASPVTGSLLMPCDTVSEEDILARFQQDPQVSFVVKAVSALAAAFRLVQLDHCLEDVRASCLREVHGDMHFVVTATTRPRRQGEVDGEDYIFMDKEDFEDLIERNELLEHALVYGDYKGIPKQQVRKALGKGTDVVLRLDVQGAATIRRLIPESLSIFLVAENERALVRRLLGRKTEPLDRALVRVETARQETKRIAEFDYVVENPSGKLEDTVRKISSIIEAEKLRMQQKAIRI